MLPGLPINQELHRIAAVELAFAIRQAADIANRPTEAIHQCRKSLKRLRALVRLGLPERRALCLSADRHFRAVGRTLAEWRDADVLMQTASKLAPELTQALDSVKRLATPKSGRSKRHQSSSDESGRKK